MTSAPMSSLPASYKSSRPKPGFVSSLLAAAALVIAGASAVEARDLFKQDAFASHKPDIKNGEYMMNAAGCAACHSSGEDDKVLSGGLKMDTFIGTFFVPNISAHPNGIGGWSNADFLNAVVNGIGKEGQHLYPVMPYTSYAGMKPEDVIDIKAYIETLPQSDNKVEAHQLSFPYNLSATLAVWKRGNFDTAGFQPDDGSQMSRGRYLVESVGACGECHTPRTLDFGLDKTRAFEGEKGLTGSVAPSLTKERLASVADDAFFKGVLMDGSKLGGTPIADPVMKRIAQGTSRLSEEDRRAMVAYLKGREIEAPKIEATPELACKDDSPQLTLASAGGDANLGGAADDFVGKYCRNCHGTGEKAQGSFPAGDLASISANAAFVTPGDKSKSLLYTSVASGRMPYGKRPAGDELKSLGDWIDSLNDAPIVSRAIAAAAVERQRPVLAWRDHAQAAVTDLAEVNEGDRAFVRYFSFRQEYNGRLPCESEEAFTKRLELYKAGFAKLLNSVSLGSSLVIAEPVAGTKDLLLRVDIRDLKWDTAKWDKLVSTYPYGYDPKSDTILKTLAADTDTDMPLMRADWFMANAPKPVNYHALLELPENIRDLEKRIGVNVDDNIKRRRVVRAVFDEGSSGVSDHNRMLERHDADQGYYWKSYDFAASNGNQSLKRNPHGPVDIEPLEEDLKAFHHDGGEMIFSLPNGLQGYYLSTATGDRIDRGPASIVAYRERPIGKGVEIINGRSCMDCHTDGIIAKRDQIREFIEASPTFSKPQRELLLEMYVEQGELQKAYAKDRDRFIDALKEISATETAPDGSLKSRTGPAKEEIITWYADLYEDDLDRDALAAEFDMTPEDFEKAIQQVKEAEVLRIGLDWVTQLKGGSKIPRFEVEQQFAALVEPLLGLAPLKLETGEAASTNETGTPEYKDPNYRDDGVKADGDKGGKLKLSVDVKNTDVFVDEKLSFAVTASNKCEMQIFYIESDGNVEEIPQAMIGEKFLEAGKPRTIPDPATGDVFFDAAGADETMLLFCREGGLGNQRLDAKGAKELAKKSGEATSRGIAVKLFEKAKAAEKAADEKAGGDAKEGGKGTSAIHLVTFDVKARK